MTRYVRGVTLDETSLSGTVVDQAQMYGLLAKLPPPAYSPGGTILNTCPVSPDGPAVSDVNT